MFLGIFSTLFRKNSSKVDAPRSFRPQGEEEIQKLGHREYVGGMWEEIGQLQFDFLVQQGLKPVHCLLDIGCGSLRGGVHFIRYLDCGNYLGIDKEDKLIQLGIEKELGWPLNNEKKPEFVVSPAFEFRKFSKRPQFAIAQSLFTHLNPADIRLCLSNLREFVEERHVFFATFLNGDSTQNQSTSHSRVNFYYSPEEMGSFGREAGWEATYTGNWNHPRSQVMMKYLPK